MGVENHGWKMELLATVLIELDKMFILEYGKYFLSQDHKTAVQNASDFLGLKTNHECRKILTSDNALDARSKL